jgi:hypothetical protein
MVTAEAKEEKPALVYKEATKAVMKAQWMK